MPGDLGRTRFLLLLHYSLWNVVFISWFHTAVHRPRLSSITHARASRNASLILIAPPLLRKQSDRCPKQKENLKAAKKKIDLSLTKCRFLSLVHGLKIASSFCFLVDGGLLDNLGNYSVYSLSGRERELERSIALLPQCRKYGATSWLRLAPRLGNSRK